MISELTTLAEKEELEDKVYCIYISPLKELDNDIEKNLEAPLKGIEEIAGKSLGIRKAVRTGDTTQYQRQKMLKRIEDRREAEKREKAKKEIERQILDAVILAVEQGSEDLAEKTADDIISAINAALSGTPAPKTQTTFSEEIGKALGRALGEAPFKLLDEIFETDEERRRKY